MSKSRPYAIQRDSGQGGGASQAEQFREMARELGCDESEERFEAALRKVASSPHTPKPEPKAKPEAKKHAK